jgi:uncharacterized protein YbcI
MKTHAATETERTTWQSASLAISNQMVQMLSRYTGRGPTKARTTLNTNVALVVFHDALTKGELNLVAAGQLDAVRMMRRTFHDLLRDDATASVEDILDRKVVACLADVDPEANVAAILFVLESQPESGRVEVGETTR